MTSQKRFLIGGLGAIMPVLVTLLSIDISAALNDEIDWSFANMLGIAFRYILFFAIGGFIAYLHSDESKPFKLFQFGIAAPALMSSWVSIQGINATPIQPQNVQSAQIEFSLFRSAYAQATEQAVSKTTKKTSFLSEVFSGLTGSVYREIKKPEDKSVTDKPTPKN